MIVVLSPSKRLNYDPVEIASEGIPLFTNKAKQLIGILKKKSRSDIQSLMNINEDLSDLNYKRYRAFTKEYTSENSKPAILAFTGDVYLGLEAKNFSSAEMEFAQNHIRILSGFYGLLKPLDSMQAYRLEMGTNLENRRGKNLYEFWGNEITKELNKELAQQEDPVLINLASKEYFASVNTKKIKGTIINIHFKEYRNGQLKFLSFNAKKARGFMSKYIVNNSITQREGLKGFNYENYYFAEELSSDIDYTFVR